MVKWYEYNFMGKRVLLVEDHPVNAWVEQKMLEKVGFEVLTAENGQKGVDLYSEYGPYYFDAILMDINMPVMDGLTAARSIRGLDLEDAKKIPIIAMTTNGFDQDFLDSKLAGMNEHLVKPVEPATLFECLVRYV